MINDTKQVSLNEVYPLMVEQLKNGGTVVFKPKGISMLPLIRQGKDSVVITKNTSPLKKYDIPLYRRDDGSFILHRIVKISADGTYITCGDNQVILEYGIKESQIIGIVTKVSRGNRVYCISSPFLKFLCFYAVLRRIYKKSFFRRAIRWGLRKCKVIK